MTNSLTPGQTAVLRAFHDFGPMHDAALATYVHHHSALNMSSSGIRSRRAELVRLGLLQVSGTKRLKSGRSTAVHRLSISGDATARRLFYAGPVTGRMSMSAPV